MRFELITKLCEKYFELTKVSKIDVLRGLCNSYLGLIKRAEQDIEGAADSAVIAVAELSKIFDIKPSETAPTTISKIFGVKPSEVINEVERNIREIVSYISYMDNFAFEVEEFAETADLSEEKNINVASEKLNLWESARKQLTIRLKNIVNFNELLEQTPPPPIETGKAKKEVEKLQTQYSLINQLEQFIKEYKKQLNKESDEGIKHKLRLEIKQKNIELADKQKELSAMFEQETEETTEEAPELSGINKYKADINNFYTVVGNKIDKSQESLFISLGQDYKEKKSEIKDIYEQQISIEEHGVKPEALVPGGKEGSMRTFKSDVQRWYENSKNILFVLSRKLQRVKYRQEMKIKEPEKYALMIEKERAQDKNRKEHLEYIKKYKESGGASAKHKKNTYHEWRKEYDTAYELKRKESGKLLLNKKNLLKKVKEQIAKQEEQISKFKFGPPPAEILSKYHKLMDQQKILLEEISVLSEAFSGQPSSVMQLSDSSVLPRVQRNIKTLEDKIKKLEEEEAGTLDPGKKLSPEEVEVFRQRQKLEPKSKPVSAPLPKKPVSITPKSVAPVPKPEVPAPVPVFAPTVHKGRLPPRKK